MTKIRLLIVVNFVLLVLQLASNNAQAMRLLELVEPPDENNATSRLFYSLINNQQSRMRPLQQASSRYSTTGGRLLTPEQGCGKTDKILNPRIVGGINARPGAFPWMALIAYGPTNGKYSFNCGGSLITSRHILTAAHCINSNLKFVRLGEHDVTTNTDGPVQDIRVVKITSHEQWSPSVLANDIALLTLERDVDFSDRVRPICLPLEERIRRSSLVGYNPFVAGWGTLHEKGNRAHVLQQVQVPILPTAVCQREYVKHGPFRITDAQICAGTIAGGKDSCQGDSGGPLMLPIFHNGSFPVYQIGIVSFGLGCARPNAPGVYTNVQRYMDWVKSKCNQ